MRIAQFCMLLFALFLSHHLLSQKLYKGETTYEKILIYSIDGNNIFKGDKTWNDPIYSFDQNSFYAGSSRFRSQQLFTFQGDYIRLVSNDLGRQIIYTVKGNKIYAGDSTFSNDCLFTFQDGKIYSGDSTFVSDILFTLEFEGEIDLRVIACLIGPY